MESLLYIVAKGMLALLQMFPLKWVARLGRLVGSAAYYLDRRHRRVALDNLHQCLGNQRSPAELKAIARENFRRIGENFACGVRTAAMDFAELKEYVEFVGPPEIAQAVPGSSPQSIVAAIGHFGNFELYARFGQFAPAFTCATTYRGLRQASLNRLLQSARERSGCQFFERRFDAQALRVFMHQPAVMLGLLADQHAGVNGIRLPFLGRECSTSAAPAVFALRYHCALYAGFCYRLGLARWRIEAGERIPTHQAGQPRPVEAIMRDINRAFEVAVMRDPANWFWVHNRWKPYKPKHSRTRVGPEEPDVGSEPAVSELR